METDEDENTEQLLAQLTPSRRTIMIITSSGKKRSENRPDYDDTKNNDTDAVVPESEYTITSTNNTKECLEWFRASRDRWQTTLRKAIQPIPPIPSKPTTTSPMISTPMQKGSSPVPPAFASIVGPSTNQSGNNIIIVGDFSQSSQQNPTPNLATGDTSAFSSPFASSSLGFHTTTTIQSSSEAAHESSNTASTLTVSANANPTFAFGRNDTIVADSNIGPTETTFQFSFGNGTTGIKSDGDECSKVFGAAANAPSTFAAVAAAAASPSYDFSFPNGTSTSTATTGWGQEYPQPAMTGFSSNTHSMFPTSTLSSPAAVSKSTNDHHFRETTPDSASSSTDDDDYDPDEDDSCSDGDDEYYVEDEYEDDDIYGDDEENGNDENGNDNAGSFVDDIREQSESPRKDEEADSGDNKFHFASSFFQGLSMESTMEPKSPSEGTPCQTTVQETKCFVDADIHNTPDGMGQPENRSQVTPLATAKTDHTAFLVKRPCDPVSGWKSVTSKPDNTLEISNATKLLPLCIQADKEFLFDKVHLDSPLAYAQEERFEHDRNGESETETNTPIVSNVSTVKLSEKNFLGDFLPCEIGDESAEDVLLSSSLPRSDELTSDAPCDCVHEVSSPVRSSSEQSKSAVVEPSHEMNNEIHVGRDDPPDEVFSVKNTSEPNVLNELRAGEISGIFLANEQEKAPVEEASESAKQDDRSTEQSCDAANAYNFLPREIKDASVDDVNDALHQQKSQIDENVFARISLETSNETYYTEPRHEGNLESFIGRHTPTDLELEAKEDNLVNVANTIPAKDYDGKLMFYEKEESPLDAIMSNMKQTDGSASSIPLLSDAETSLRPSPSKIHEYEFERQCREENVDLSVGQASDIREAETPKVSNAAEDSGCLPATCLVSCSNEIIEFVRDELCNTKKHTKPICHDSHPDVRSEIVCIASIDPKTKNKTTPISDESHFDERSEIALKEFIDTTGGMAQEKEEILPNHCIGSLYNPLQEKFDEDPSKNTQSVMPEESESSSQDDHGRKERTSNMGNNLLKTSNNVQINGVPEVSERDTWKGDGSDDQPIPRLLNECSDKFDYSQENNTLTGIVSNLNEDENTKFSALRETKESSVAVQSRGQVKSSGNILDEMIIEVSGLGVQTACCRDNSDSISQGKARTGTRKLAVSPGRLSTASSPSRSIKTGTSSFESLTENIEVLQQDLDDSIEKIEHMKQKIDEQQQMLNNRPNRRAEAIVANFPRTLMLSENSTPNVASDARNENSTLNRIEEESQSAIP
jgi:hypothetical protein